jgi:hypothetical protein
MYPFRLLFGLLLFLAVVTGRADDRPPGGAPPREEDLKKLQGSWMPAQPRKDGRVYLEFEKTRILDVTHALEAKGGEVDVKVEFAAFALKEQGEKRLITPTRKSERISPLVYRFDGDTLVIEDGSCNIHDRKVSLKGRWKRLGGDLEKLQGTWVPAGSNKAGAGMDLEFDKEVLTVARKIMNKLGMGPVDQTAVLFALKEDDGKRVLTPAEGCQWLSKLTYRVEGDKLFIDKGEYGLRDRERISLKGEWKRLPGDRPVP